MVEASVGESLSQNQYEERLSQRVARLLKEDPNWEEELELNGLRELNVGSLDQNARLLVKENLGNLGWETRDVQKQKPKPRQKRRRNVVALLRVPLMPSK